MVVVTYQWLFMADETHIERLHSERELWNKWISEGWKTQETVEYRTHEGIARRVLKTRADLSKLDLTRFGAFNDYQFYKVNLSEADLSGLTFRNCNFRKANLSKAKIHGAKFYDCNFDYCSFIQSDSTNSEYINCSLIGVNFSRANLFRVNFSVSKLIKSSLKWGQLIETRFYKSDLSYSQVYGTSVWNCTFEDCVQNNISINNINEPKVSIDNIEVAQFVYLLINNPAIRKVIDTVTSKVVLILGRFTVDRIQVLQSIRNELRNQNYVPVLFDFEKAQSRDLTETISALAHLSRFIIVDLTDARSVPQELSHIVPNLPSVPVQPIMEGASAVYGMFEHFERYPWVLKVKRYYTHSEVNDTFLKIILQDIENKK